MCTQFNNMRVFTIEIDLFSILLSGLQSFGQIKKRWFLPYKIDCFICFLLSNLAILSFDGLI